MCDNPKCNNEEFCKKKQVSIHTHFTVYDGNGAYLGKMDTEHGQYVFIPYATFPIVRPVKKAGLTSQDLQNIVNNLEALNGDVQVLRSDADSGRV